MNLLLSTPAGRWVVIALRVLVLLLAAQAASAAGEQPELQDRVNTWLEQINAMLRQPSAWLAALPAAAEATLCLTVLASLAGLLALIVWRAVRPASTRRGWVLSVVAALALAGIPVLVLYLDKPTDLNLILTRRQLWSAWLMFYAALKLHMPLDQVFSQQTRFLLMSTSTCALALLAVSTLLYRSGGRTLHWLAFACICLLAAAPVLSFSSRFATTRLLTQELAEGTAAFEARCKSAGAKRLHPVGGIEGIRLTGLRQDAGDGAHSDRDWPEAGIPGDLVGMAYIRSFLDFDFQDRRGNAAWSIPGLPGMVTMRGYRFVDVLQADGSYLRYRLVGDSPAAGLATEQISAERAARYAVNYARNDTPQDRRHWVAGATVTVSDTRTGQVAGELKVFSHAPPTRGATDFARRSWHQARTCPVHEDFPGAMVRIFTEQVVQRSPQ